MSSWLSLSLPNPFKSSDDPPPSDHSPPPPAGVKDDLSVLGQTIGRQLRGVASFLAPPPSPPPPQSAADESSSSSQTLLGIKNDLVEIGGSFKSSLSLLSSNKAVTEISRFATNLLQFEEEVGEEREEALGITDEVLDFVREISLRPECWTDFPLSLHNEYDMSEVQREHAAVVEQYVPNLEALRHEVCKELSEEQFWMIYFILLLPRLDENDAKLLSTPEIIEVREMLLQKLRNKKNAPVKIPKDSEIVNTVHNDENVATTQVINNPSPSETVPAEGVEMSNIENTDQWLEEEDIDTSASIVSRKPPQNEEDVSFSDLEDEEDDSDRFSGRQSGFRSDEGNKVPSRSESSEWVRLSETSLTMDDRQRAVGPSTSREKESEGEESNDWLTVDDVDF